MYCQVDKRNLLLFDVSSSKEVKGSSFGRTNYYGSSSCLCYASPNLKCCKIYIFWWDFADADIIMGVTGRTWLYWYMVYLKMLLIHFRNLKKIEGLQKRFDNQYSLVIMTDEGLLRELCLNSLQEITSGENDSFLWFDVVFYHVWQVLYRYFSVGLLEYSQ